MVHIKQPTSLQVLNSVIAGQEIVALLFMFYYYSILKRSPSYRVKKKLPFIIYLHWILSSLCLSVTNALGPSFMPNLDNLTETQIFEFLNWTMRSIRYANYGYLTVVMCRFYLTKCNAILLKKLLHSFSTFCAHADHKYAFFHVSIWVLSFLTTLGCQRNLCRYDLFLVNNRFTCLTPIRYYLNIVVECCFAAFNFLINFVCIVLCLLATRRTAAVSSTTNIQASATTRLSPRNSIDSTESGMSDDGSTRRLPKKSPLRNKRYFMHMFVFSGLTIGKLLSHISIAFIELILPDNNYATMICTTFDTCFHMFLLAHLCVLVIPRVSRTLLYKVGIRKKADGKYTRERVPSIKVTPEDGVEVPRRLRDSLTQLSAQPGQLLLSLVANPAMIITDIKKADSMDSEARQGSKGAKKKSTNVVENNFLNPASANIKKQRKPRPDKPEHLIKKKKVDVVAVMMAKEKEFRLRRDSVEKIPVPEIILPNYIGDDFDSEGSEEQDDLDENGELRSVSGRRRRLSTGSSTLSTPTGESSGYSVAETNHRQSQFSLFELPPPAISSQDDESPL